MFPQHCNLNVTPELGRRISDAGGKIELESLMPAEMQVLLQA